MSSSSSAGRVRVELNCDKRLRFGGGPVADLRGPRTCEVLELEVELLGKTGVETSCVVVPMMVSSS